jgi:hypothetical protein
MWVDEPEVIGNLLLVSPLPQKLTVSTPTGNDVMADIERVVPKKAGSVVWLCNNVDYIVRLEEGYSPQAPPQAMVRRSIQLVTDVFR